MNILSWTREKIIILGINKWTYFTNMVVSHHPVFNINKPGKLPDVFDAAATFQSKRCYSKDFAIP